MNNENKSIRNMKTSMILCYAMIIIIIVVALSYITITQTDRILRENVSALSSELNSQMRMNINSYLERCESTATLVFADKENYTYDATDPDNDEYEALNTESRISSNLFNLCIMENFVDFAIVYSNNHVIGKISNATRDNMKGDLYESISSVITRNGTNDGWKFGLKGDRKHIYYAKRLNDNAVLVVSVYSAELENIMEHPDAIKDMAVRVADSDMNIIFSSKGQNDSEMPDDLRLEIGSNTSATLYDEHYLATINQCNDDWYVITSIPTSYITEKKNQIQMQIILIATIAALVAIIFDILISFVFTDPIDRIVDKLGQKASHDQLTGLLNKRTFEDRVSDALKHTDMRFGLIIFDIDDFKSINDSLGHADGDKVLAFTGEMLREHFSEDDIAGRIGGDEFAVLTVIDSKEDLSLKCDKLCRLFSGHSIRNSNVSLTSSIGAASFPDDGMDFDTLYSDADKALYSSKRRGKNTYTIFNGEDEQ